MKVRCQLCFRNNKVTLRDSKLSIFYCGLCHHRFAVLKKEKREKYTSEYFQDAHKNWFKYPNYKLFEYILKHLPKRGISLLDVGCGDGTFLKYVLSKRKNIKLYGIDLIKNNHPKINFIKGDILTYKTNKKFDIIVTLSTIDHINNPHKFIRVLKQMIKKDGIIFIDTIDNDALIARLSELIKPLWRFPYEMVFNLQHLNYFTKKSLRKLVKDENLNIIEQMHHNFPFKAVDIPKGNLIIQNFCKAMIVVLLLLSSIISRQTFQTIICVKGDASKP